MFKPVRPVAPAALRRLVVTLKAGQLIVKNGSVYTMEPQGVEVSPVTVAALMLVSKRRKYRGLGHGRLVETNDGLPGIGSGQTFRWKMRVNK